MFAILRHRTYRHLFLAQVIALAGTGIATVALGLLAFDLAGAEAGLVLGTALAIKMLANVLIAPLAGAYLDRLSRRQVLVVLDVVRLGVVLALPWVDQIWQVYLLIFLLQAASAAFTPLFQATIPEVLPDEADYTRALTLSRLAYDLESLLSPSLAAGLLLVVSFHGLFLGTALGFLGSALLVVTVVLPRLSLASRPEGPWRRVTHGARIYLSTPRLRGLLALTLSAAAGGALVFVNTVVVVRESLARPDRAVALALAAFGAGSMVVALLLPKTLERLSDRIVMLVAANAMSLVLTLLAVAWPWLGVESRWWMLLGGWCLLGACYAALVTPAGRLLRRSAPPADRPALFAAQFSLSHSCWLLTYPLTGWLGLQWGIAADLWAMAGIAALGAAIAWYVWPADDPELDLINPD